MTLNYPLIQGDDFYLDIAYFDDNGTPLAITSDIRLRVGKAIDGTRLVEVPFTNGEAVIPSSITQTFQGTCRYEVAIVNSSTSDNILQNGQLQINQGVL